MPSKVWRDAVGGGEGTGFVWLKRTEQGPKGTRWRRDMRVSGPLRAARADRDSGRPGHCTLPWLIFTSRPSSFSCSVLQDDPLSLRNSYQAGVPSPVSCRGNQGTERSGCSSQGQLEFSSEPKEKNRSSGRDITSLSRQS